MTQEEKARAYDEALKRAEAAINIAADKDLVKGVATTIFPELCESEDERIRKNLIRMVQNVRNDSTEKGYYDISFDKYIAWLEKQKEQKPVEPSDEELQRHQDELTEFKKFATKQAKENQLHISYTRDVMWENFCSELLSFVNSRKLTEKQDYSGLNDLEKAIHRGFLAAGVENVPVTIIKETAKDCLVQTGLIRWELPEDFEEAVFNVVNFMSPFSSEDELREISHRFATQLLSLAKEEIIKHLHEALNSVDITFPYRYVLVEAIEALSQPSLPSNLDEATNRQAALEQPYKWEEEQDGSFGVTPLFVMSNIRSAFKAGAEWMAEQGVMVEAEIEEPEPLYWRILLELPGTFMVDHNLKPGDEVIIQIRKKNE